MVAVAAAQLEQIVPDVTHPTKWETTASRVYVLMGSPGPAISTNPPEMSMEVPAAPNQSWNSYDFAGYRTPRKEPHQPATHRQGATARPATTVAVHPHKPPPES